MNDSKDSLKLSAKEDGIVQIDIRGEPSALINCKKNVSFKVTRIFGKAINTTNIHDIEFRSCKEVLIESDLPQALVNIRNCTFNLSCLKFKFTRHIQVVEIVVSNSIFKSCNCPYGIIQVSTTRDIHPNIALHGLTVTESLSPFLLSKLQLLVTLRGQSVFQHNEGFKIEVENNSKLLFFEATVHFRNNRFQSKLQRANTIIAKQATIAFEDSAIMFTQNEGSPSGAIMASKSTHLIIEDNVTINFIENTGLKGGALSLYTDSILIFSATQSSATINFVSNTALFGGGIYVEDGGYTEVKSVFDLQGDSELVKVNFGNNSALLGGSQIYGGWVLFTDKHKDVKHILNLDTNDDNKNLVASDPVRICLCSYNYVKEEYVMDCNKTKPTVTVYGCTFDLALVAVGQMFTPVLSYVESAVKEQGSNERHSDNNIISPKMQSLQKTCTKVQYKIDHFRLSPCQERTITLSLEPYLEYSRPPKPFNDSFSQLLFTQLTLQLMKKKGCPLGYTRNENQCECSCLSLLTSLKLGCDANGNINRSKQQWVGVVYSTNEQPMVVAHEYCPFDYCIANENTKIHLEDPDRLCAFNRRGILCGSCKANFSRMLGTSKCGKCSNRKLLIIVPCILLAGR